MVHQVSEDASLTAAGTSTVNLGQSKANGVAVALNRLPALDLGSPTPPQAGNSFSPSTQRTLVESDGESEEHVCETPDQVPDLGDALAGLDLEGGGSKGVRLMLPPRIRAQDLESGNEEEDDTPAAAATAAVAAIRGRGLPKLTIQLGLPQPSVITDLGEELAGLHQTRTDSNPTTADLTPGRLADQLSLARYKHRFVPLGQLQRLINTDAVEQQLEKLERSLLKRVKHLIRPASTRDKLQDGLQAEARRICGKGDQSCPVYYNKRDSEVDPSPQLPSEKRFQKIMAILLLIDRPSKIRLFVKEGVCDADLPLAWVQTTSYPHKRWALRRRKDHDTRLRCFDNWSQLRLDQFERTQWAVHVPFFARRPDDPKKVQHYDLPDRVVMPWAVFETHARGGSSQVYKSEIHPEHHNFAQFTAPGSKPNLFAVKMLLSTDKDVFKKEVEILRRVSRRPHTHLIALLATYRYREHYHLVFPWAEDNLETFWRRTTPQQNDATARWLAEQCRGLASGLATIHQYRRTSTDSIVDVLGLAEPQGPERCHPGVLFCRHGDIKPQNILWFPGRDGSKGVLKICDFGVAEFNLNDTVPRTKRPPATPMYEPPEAYVPRTDAVIGTSYDVWGLACVFLEFLSWHLGGWEYVSNFLDRRLAVDDHIPRYFDTGKLRVGTFFLIEGEDATGALRAAVKASVHEFIDELHSDPKCTELIHDVLVLIKQDMLLVEGKRRITADRVAEKLERMQLQANLWWSGYFTDLAPWQAPT